MKIKIVEDVLLSFFTNGYHFNEYAVFYYIAQNRYSDRIKFFWQHLAYEQKEYFRWIKTNIFKSYRAVEKLGLVRTIKAFPDEPFVHILDTELTEYGLSTAKQYGFLQNKVERYIKEFKNNDININTIFSKQHNTKLYVETMGFGFILDMIKHYKKKGFNETTILKTPHIEIFTRRYLDFLVRECNVFYGDSRDIER